MAGKNYVLYQGDPPYEALKKFVTVHSDSKGDADSVAKLLSEVYVQHPWHVKRGKRTVSVFYDGKKER